MVVLRLTVRQMKRNRILTVPEIWDDRLAAATYVNKAISKNVIRNYAVIGVTQVLNSNKQMICHLPPRQDESKKCGMQINRTSLWS